MRIHADVTRERSPWSPVSDPYRDPQATAVLFLSWLPLLLSGARIGPLSKLYQWHARGRWVFMELPTMACCSCATWGWGGAFCAVHGVGE